MYKKKDCRDRMCEELIKVYGFKDALGTGIQVWDRCLQYHEKGTDLYTEVILVGSVYILREQRGEEVKFNYYYWPDALMERIDMIL